MEKKSTENGEAMDLSLLNVANPEDEQRIRSAFAERNWSDIKARTHGLSSG